MRQPAARAAVTAESAPPDERWGRAGLLAAIAGLVALLGLIVGRGLRSRPIVLWDESRVAVNAAELYASGRWLVTTYAGRPDLWNTKPPLLVWLQAALLRLGAAGEVAVRLPSAAAAAAVVLALLLFCHVFLRDTLAGLAAALVVLGSAGFTGLHVARTGDYDALLAWWTTAYALAYFVYLETAPARRGRALAAFWAALLAAVLTKGIAAPIGLPALLLYTGATGRLGRVLRDPGFHAGAAATLLGVAAFLVLRERAAPGFVHALVGNDVAGRFARVSERHGGDAGFYLREFAWGRFAPWVYLVPPAVAAVAWGPPDRSRRLGLYALTFAATALLVLESSQTKLWWYDAQLYPPLALVIGLGVARGVRALGGRAALVQGATVALLSLPALAQLRTRDRPSDVTRRLTSDAPQLHYGELFADLRARGGLTRLQVVDGGFVRQTGYNAPLRFYLTVANARGATIEYVAPESVRADRPVVSCDEVAWRAAVAGRAVVPIPTRVAGCHAGRVRRDGEHAAVRGTDRGR